MTSSVDRSRQASELRRLAEESDQGQKGQSPIQMEAMSLEETQRLLHELRVHQIELEMQNDELGRAQNELAAERARYFDLYNLAPVGYCTVSEQGLLLEANLQATNLLGLTHATLKGQRISRFIIEADQDIYYLLRKNLFATTEPQNCELRMVKIDGTVFWAALTISLAWDEVGKPIIPMVLRDISERKQAETLLHRKQAMLERTEKIAQIGSWEWDVATDTVIWSDELFHLFQLEPAERGPSFAKHPELYHPDDMERLKAAVEAAVNNGTPYELELRALRKDGTTRVCLARGQAEMGQGHRATRLVGSLQDITERKRIEEAAKDISVRLSLATKAGGVGIWEYDVADNRLQWEEQMYALYGISPETFGGAHESWCAGVHPEDIARSDLEVERALRGEKEVDTEFRVVWPDGTVHHIQALATVLRDADGKPLRMIGTNWDITDRKQAEEEQKKLQIQLQQAQKMEAIGTLAGGIAHDFNNILGAILGYAEMAQEDSLAGSILRQDIDQIVKAGLRARDLVKQILAFSRQAETEQIPLQPGVIIREACNMLRSSLPATIAIEQDIDQKAGLVLIDPTQIHQIVMNLCTNAFHAMEESGGILSISLKNKVLSRVDLLNMPHMQPGKFVELTVGDTGSGIAPEIRERIFEPYFTTKEVGKGTGMGLAIIYGIAMSYGGSVSCQSKPGEGTVFQVYLPVVDDSALLDKQAEVHIQRGSEHILFVDDEEILAEMGKNMLERLGYQVTVRKNSIEALTTFQNQPQDFDLVITDQTMPGMTGSDLARRMLQIRPDLPIILCTGYSSLITEEKARSLGIKGFAMKPLAKKDIAALIRTMLDRGA